MMAFVILPCICTVAVVLAQSASGSSDIYRYVQGDVTIVGLFDLSKGMKCDEPNTDASMTLDAIKWYLQRLNDNGDLPFKLGLKGYDTCGAAGTAVSTALDVIYQDTCSQENTDNSIGFISMLSNEDTLSLATVLKSIQREDQFLHISVAATSTELTDRRQYPNFFRVIADDTKMITALIQLLKNLEWNRIGIIHENKPIWSHLVDILDTTARENAICISKTAMIETNMFGEVDLKQIDDALDHVLKSSTLIGGVVFVGSDTVARNVLERSDHLDIASLPRFVLTGTIGLDTDVFQSVNKDHALTKTKGSLVIVPAFTEITSFTEYRESLVTVSEELEHKLLHVKYGIIAAHAIARVTKEAFLSQCNRTQSLCIRKIQPSTLISRMNFAKLDLNTDFITSVQPLASSGYRLYFNNSADPIQLSDDDIYQVYLFRQVAGTQPELRKVGSLSRHDKLTLNTTAINNYGEEAGTGLRIGQCPVGKKCMECLKKDIPEHQIHIPGDIYVIGIAPVYNKGEDVSGCSNIYPEGYEMARALQFGLEVFSTSENYTEYRSKFGDKRIGMVILNSCTNDLVIVRKILDLYKYGIDEDQKGRRNITDRVLGYIGAFTSDVSLRVADPLTEMKQVQISYASTTSKLSDNINYPFFLRVVPSDTIQVQAILHILRNLSVEYMYVQVLYAEKDYGEAALESLNMEAPKYNICIAQSLKIQQNDNYFKYYDEIVKYPNAKMIILFLHHQILVGLMRDLTDKMRVGAYHFIASDGWGRHKDLLDNKLAFGAITIALEMKDIDGLIPYIQNQTIAAYHHDFWREEYLQDHQDCYYDWSFDKTYTSRCPNHTMPPSIDFPRDGWGNFATLSVLALLKGSAEFYSHHCTNSEAGLCEDFTQDLLTKDGLVETIKHISMDITGQGETRVFDENGDGNIGYSIYSIQKNKSDDNKLAYVKIGIFDHHDRGNELKMDLKELKEQEIKSPCPNKQACKPENCGYTSVGTKPDSPTGNIVEYPTTLVTILASAVGALGLILGIQVLACVIKLKNKSGSETPGTQYITPLEMAGNVNNATDNYHDILIHEETQY